VTIDTLPELTTISITPLSTTSAKSGGDITNDGGSPIIARGICWSINPDESIAGLHSTDGTGTGNFQSTLIGIDIQKTYYVRAYATNKNGTSYGNEVVCTGLIIGASYQGGVIAWIDNTKIHGIIAAPYDQSTACGWQIGSFNIQTGADNMGFYGGSSNTNKIVAAYGAEKNAARLCYDLVIDGYSDWYLPSYDELYQLWYNRGKFVKVFTPNVYKYWSSTESVVAPNKVGTAYRQSFQDGTRDTYYKSSSFGVHAVRAF
jgi:hypothetical protein